MLRLNPCVLSVYCLVAGAERENATRVKSAGCVSQKLVAGAGFEPVGAKSANTTTAPHTSANSLQDNALAPSATDGDSHISTHNIQRSNESQQPKCVPDVYRNLPADLSKVIAAWDDLDEQVRRKIVEIVEQRG